MSSLMRKEELDLGLRLSCGEIHAKEAPTYGMEWNGVTQASPWLSLSSRMIGSEGSMDFSAAQPVGMTSSESMTRAGYYVPPLVANKPVSLELTIGPHVPAINNLNLLPPESQQAGPVPRKTWLGMKTTANPFERPLLGRLERKDPPSYGPFILESSEVAKEYAQKQREAAKNKRRVVGEVQNPAPAKRRVKWPAKTVAKINEKIEKLKQEAARNPAERRSLLVIETEIDALQAKKDQIHARVSGQLEAGQGSSSARGGRAPTRFGN